MSEKKFLIIDSRPYGLFSIFLHTLDNIKWAKDNGYIPVVRWGPGRRDPNLGREGAREASMNGHPKHVVDKTNFLTEEKPSSWIQFNRHLRENMIYQTFLCLEN